MRPRRLWMQGLRSYRQPVEVDFTEGGLLAIVGDTGAGKSSILEAITYALYNATTWDQRNVKALISDGMQTMVVELVFDADGHTYRVRRSTSVGPSPPSVHLLTCVDDPDLLRVDGEAAVAAEIKRLVGLDYAGFKAAVVLPQGQFDRLLHATAGQRTELLKGIFRLEDLDRVRLAAAEARDGAQELWFELRTQRSQLRADPVADFAQAEADAARHGQRVTALSLVEDQVRAHTEAERTFTAEAERLRGVADLVAKANLSQAAVLHALGRVDAEIAEQICELTRERDGWAERNQAAAAELATAEREGRSMAALNRVCTCLERARQCEREARTRRTELEEWQRKSASALKRAAHLGRSVPQLEAQVAEQAKLADAAREACESAQRSLQEYANQVRQIRDEARRLEREIERRDRLRAEWSRQRDRELPALERAHGDAQRQMHEAEKLLESLQREHAAHLAAAGLHAGDPCPVCERALPEGWTAPPAGDLEQARSTLTQARRDAEVATKQLAALSSALEEKERSLQEMDRLLDEQTRIAESHTAELRAVAPEFDARRTDADGLDGYRAVVAGTRDDAEHATKALTATRELLAWAQSDLAAAIRERAACDEQIASLQERVTRCEHDADEALAPVPARLRPDRAASDPFAPALERVAEELRAVERLEAERSDARNHLDRLGLEVRKAEDRRAREVQQPARQAVHNVALLLQRLRDAAPDLDGIHLEDLSPDAGLQGQTAWATTIESRAAAGVSRLQERAAKSAECSAEARHARQAALSDAGFGQEEGLHNALRAARVDQAMAQRVADEARAQIEPASELDRAIESGSDIVANLGELARLLTDGRFVSYVVGRRQRVLLELASDILLSVTGDRYGFTEKFEIVDTISNQTRPAKTLSGGETFLASLSLALGLVEMAARAGGKLDALFLDEGFGSLDVNALEFAMSALERRASQGKLVCVISHIKAVAERIERVLLVTRTPRGSEVRVADRSERAALVEDELEAGLLQ